MNNPRTAPAAPALQERMLIVPHENDILMGRGGTNNLHIGNQKFRKLAERKIIQYSTCSRKEKPTIYRGLVLEVFNMTPPGRFLTKDKKSGRWTRVALDKALEKASRMLRDAVAAYNSGTLQRIDHHQYDNENEPLFEVSSNAVKYCKRRRPVPPSDRVSSKRQKLHATPVNDCFSVQHGRRRWNCSSSSCCDIPTSTNTAPRMLPLFPTHISSSSSSIQASNEDNMILFPINASWTTNMPDSKVLLWQSSRGEAGRFLFDSTSTN